MYEEDILLIAVIRADHFNWSVPVFFLIKEDKLEGEF